MCGDLVVLVGVGGVDQGNADPGPQGRGEEVEGLCEGLHVVGGLGEEELQACHTAITLDSACRRVLGLKWLTDRAIDLQLMVQWQGSVAPVTLARISEVPININWGICHMTLMGDT